MKVFTLFFIVISIHLMEAFEIMISGSNKTFSCGSMDVDSQETSYEFRCIFKHNGDNCEYKYKSTAHMITGIKCNTFG